MQIIARKGSEGRDVDSTGAKTRDNSLGLWRMMSWRNWSLMSVSRCSNRGVCRSAPWGPGPAVLPARRAAALWILNSPWGWGAGIFCYVGILASQHCSFPLPCIWVFSSKLHSGACYFWKLLPHILPDNPFFLDNSLSQYPSFSIFTGFLEDSVLPLFWIMWPFPFPGRCGCSCPTQCYWGAEAERAP